MDTKFVDTNIFIEIAARIGKKSSECVKLLESKESNLWTTELVIVETEWVLRSFYKKKKTEVIEFIRRILLLRSIHVDCKAELLEALKLHENMKVGLVDCINVVLARARGIKKVISYDKHFDKFGGIRRVEP